jgi:ABC-type nitrate/sulfonate/bicarbonate transport system ATPase subunit
MLPFETKELLLKVDRVCKSYDGTPILHDVQIEIHNLVRPEMTQGQIVSLVGKSGSGKSTLFRIMAGLEAPDSGSIQIWHPVSTDIDADGGDFLPVEEGQVGVVFQNSYVYPWRRVIDILRMAANKNTMAKPAEAIAHYAELLSLEDHLGKYSSQLSGGQRQRVAIAEQILLGSEFILMDEPFSGLDTLTIDRVTDTLMKIAQTDERKTIVIVSHDLSNCLAISDTAFILHPQEGGATVTHKVCLASEGLAWQPGIKENPMFRELLNLVKSKL